jgi:hypothetical protein
MTTRNRRNTRRATRQAIELAAAVPAVVAHRMGRLAVAGPSPSARDRDEFRKMGDEKVAAFYESWNAMFAEMYRASLRFWFSPLHWLPPTPGTTTRHAAKHLERTGLAVLTKGIAPVHRRAVANARRLARGR